MNCNKIPQEIADMLIAIQKYLTDPHNVNVPAPGKRATFVAKDITDKYTENIFAAVSLTRPNKATYQLMYNGGIILLRLDLAPKNTHLSPNGEIFRAGTPHLHIYSEQYGDSMAVRLPDTFAEPQNIYRSFVDFLHYANIINADEANIHWEGDLFYE